MNEKNKDHIIIEIDDDLNEIQAMRVKAPFIEKCKANALLLALLALTAVFAFILTSNYDQTTEQRALNAEPPAGGEVHDKGVESTTQLASPKAGNSATFDDLWRQWKSMKKKDAPKKVDYGPEIELCRDMKRKLREERYELMDNNLFKGMVAKQIADEIKLEEENEGFLQLMGRLNHANNEWRRCGDSDEDDDLSDVPEILEQLKHLRERMGKEYLGMRFKAVDAEWKGKFKERIKAIGKERAKIEERQRRKGLIKEQKITIKDQVQLLASIPIELVSKQFEKLKQKINVMTKSMTAFEGHFRPFSEEECTQKIDQLVDALKQRKVIDNPAKMRLNILLIHVEKDGELIKSLETELEKAEKEDEIKILKGKLEKAKNTKEDTEKVIVRLQESRELQRELEEAEESTKETERVIFNLMDEAMTILDF